MLYYCGKPDCKGHQLFSEDCRQRQVAQAKPASNLSRYKPPRRYYEQFDIPATSEAKPALAVTV